MEERDGEERGKGGGPSSCAGTREGRRRRRWRRRRGRRAVVSQPIPFLPFPRRKRYVLRSKRRRQNGEIREVQEGQENENQGVKVERGKEEGGGRKRDNGRKLFAPILK